MSRESFATGDFKFIFFVFAFASRLLLVPLPFYYALQVCQVKKKKYPGVHTTHTLSDKETNVMTVN